MKIRNFAICAWMAAAMMSCQKNVTLQEHEDSSDGTATLSYKVTLDYDVTKASASGTAVNKLFCGVYQLIDGDYVYLDEVSKLIDIDVAGSASFAPGLFVENTYKVVFFAQYYDAEGKPAYEIDPSLPVLTTPEEAVNGCEYDAFVGCDYIELTGNTDKTVTLVRPFSQLNIGCSETDWNNAVTLGSTPSKAVVKVASAYTQYNLLEGAVKGAASEVSFVREIGGEEFVVDGYRFLANIALLPSEACAVELKVYDDAGKLLRTLDIEGKDSSPVPFAVNSLVNVYGDIMTGIAGYTVKIDSGFASSLDCEIGD